MKVALAYYLLFFYAVALFKPALPLVSDALAHAFLQQEHMQTVHRDHGSEHVHTEMAAAAGEQQEKAPEVRFSEPVSVHLPCEEFLAVFPFPDLHKISFPLLSFSASTLPLGIDIPPPKALA